jgi:CubicO group peptidase (beta-lactamase class C family)
MTHRILGALTAASLLATIAMALMMTPVRASARTTSPPAATRDGGGGEGRGSEGERDLTKLDDFFSRVAGEIPRGLEVLIVQNGREIYWKQFGGWRRDAQAPIASATKWYSAAVIMSLVDEGKLSLDDRASRYLAYLTGDKAAITIRQLMSHTAGFPGEFPLAHRCLGDPADTLDHCAQALAAVPLRAEPGTAFIYAGAGMQIAGRVAEVATGQDWQTLFRERIAAPLGMTATDYEYEGPTRNPRISGGGRSTVSDYMKFLTMVAHGGVSRDEPEVAGEQRQPQRQRRVLSADAVEVMLRDQTGGVPIVESPFQRGAVRNAGSAANRYGIGNWLEDLDAAGRSTWHSSPGAFGWTPLIDTSRDLQMVVGVWAVGKFQPHYAELRRLLRELFPEVAPASGSPAAAPSAAASAAASVQPPAAPSVVPASASLVSQAQVSQPHSTQLQDAQPQTGRPEGAQAPNAQARERLKQLEERLALTPDQKERLRPVLQDELQQLKALREQQQSGNNSRRDRRKLARDFRHIQSETDKKLRAILSASQMTEMKKIREEWRQQLRDRATDKDR